MSTGLAVLVTCLAAACGGGNSAKVAADLTLSNPNASDVSGIVSAAGNPAAASSDAASSAAAAAPVETTLTTGATAAATTPADATSDSMAGGTGMAAGADTTLVAAAGAGADLGGGLATIALGGAASPALAVRVDVSRIPAPGLGTDKVNVAPTDEVAPAGEGAFRTVCGFAHMSFDDPIVYPGQPGRSHLHTFFGNTGADANSTAASLRNTGNSTCRGGIANRSSYWVPTLIDTQSHTPLTPDTFIAYYKHGSLPAASVQPLPTGLRMIAGDPSASAPSTTVFSMRWKCIGGPNNQNGLYQASIGNCDLGASLYQEVFFPQCWDGLNLDSPDHKSHMSYPVNVRNQDGSSGSHPECPKTHPVALPQITFNVTYLVREKDAPLRWRLASDMYDRSQPGGYSSHGDWFNGWKSEISDAFARSCIEAKKDCHAHLLGDGRKIF